MGLSKILQYGFLLFVFLLPFQTVYLWRDPFIGGEKWQYGTIALYGTDVILFLIIIFFVISSGYIRKMYDVGFRNYEKEGSNSWASILKSKIIHHTALVLLLALLLWSGLSILWAEDQMLAWYFFLKVLLGAVVLLIAHSFDTDIIKKVIFTLLLAGVLQSGIGIAQFLSQQSFSSTVLGMSTHEAWQAGSSVLKIDGERMLRAYGTFPHPNMLGGFLAVVFVSGIAYQVLCMKEPAKREKSKRPLSVIPHHLSPALYLSSLVVILLGLILTFSRTAWLGAGLGIIILLVASYFLSNTRKLRSWFSGLPVKMLGVVVCAGIVFVGVLHAQVFPRFDRATIAHEGSVSERVQSFYDAKTVMDATPLFFGTGAGNFTARLLWLEGERPVWTLQPVHNVFVLIFAELGVIGLFLFLLFISTLLPSFRKGNIIPRPWNYVTCFGEERLGQVIFGIAVLTLVPSLLLDHWLWTSHFGLFFFFLLLGLSQSKDGE